MLTCPAAARPNRALGGGGGGWLVHLVRNDAGGANLGLYVAALWEGGFQFFKDRKSVILGVWAAPGAPEALPKGGGLRPPFFGMLSRASGATQTSKMTDFRSLNNLKNL